VLEDNVRVPSGVAYSEAIRRAGMEAMPELYGAYRSPASSPTTIGCGRRWSSPPRTAWRSPTCAWSRAGDEDPAFFEHRRIAEACGVAVLTLGGCRVSNGAVFAREDGRRLDVIYAASTRTTWTRTCPS
jgi:carboxylate-amine ligase